MAQKRYHRDVAVTMQAGALAHSGSYYDQRIERYGCLYLEDGAVRYTVDAKGESIMEHLYEKTLDGANALECVYHVGRFEAGIPADDAERMASDECRAVLEQRYSEDFVAVFQALDAVEPDDSARPLLASWCESQDCPDSSFIANLAQWAMRAKILTAEGYQSLVAAEEDADAPADERVFYGYAFKPDNADWQFKANGSHMTLLVQYDRMLAEGGAIVGPLYRKAYPNALQPAEARKRFLADMAALFDPKLQGLTTMLSSLCNPAVKTLAGLLEGKIAACSEDERALVEKYLRILHVA